MRSGLVAGTFLGALAFAAGVAQPQVLAPPTPGTVHDKPLAETRTKLGGLGSPARGPDLSRMALDPLDLGRGIVATNQRYLRDPDDVAKYEREFNVLKFGSSVLASLIAVVELRPTQKSAKDYLGLLRSVFHGPEGRAFLLAALKSGVPKSERKNVRMLSVSVTPVTAGDDAFAYTANFTAFNLPFQGVFCAVRRGSVVETLTVVGFPHARIAPRDTARLARTAVARIDRELRR